MNNTISILASFATLKELNDSKKYKNSYQILSEFIAHIIKTQKIMSFTTVEMKNRLSEVFGFNIPEAVVKTASKNLPFVTKDNGKFIVDREQIDNEKSLSELLFSAENKSINIIDRVIDFIKEKKPNEKIDIEKITQNLVAFLIDDRQKFNESYTNLISEFILINENDIEMQEELNSIREGSILYIGLNYNINETGSLGKQLTLYLDTEVLFSLVGYNGTIYKTLANDFYLQVRNANSKDKKISLRYFSVVKEEIDNFFKSAELIVDGESCSYSTPAMKFIINGCASSSDVKVKQADFYYNLKHTFGIVEEEIINYYAKENHSYNLESLEYSDPQDQEGWKYISYINILRKGKYYNDNTESEYILVTNTGHILKISQIQSEKLKKDFNLDNVNDYAVSVDRITNILWYKLGNGFGSKEYPNNVRSILKAKTVLSSSILHNVADTYRQVNEQFKKGEITQEQLASRILLLHKKPLLPEELVGDSIEDNMDFSEDFLSRFEEEMNANRNALKEKDEKIVQKDNIIETQLKEKEELELSNKQLESQLAAYREIERKKKEKKYKRICIFHFVMSIFWKIAIIFLLTIMAIVLETKFDSNIPLYICAAIDLIGLVITIWVTIKKDYTKYILKKCNDEAQEPKQSIGKE